MGLPADRQEIARRNAYERPQCSACFIQAVDDDLMSIYELVKSEARLFKYGSGTGTNFSTIRGKQEKLSGGGTSSGLMSFLEVLDRAAGATKSGGTTRRAAKMVCLDIDHPEIVDFINWKVREEKKAQALIAAGYEADFGSKIRIGSVDDVNTKIAEGNGFAYYPEGRMWVTKYPAEALDKARGVYSAPELTGMEAGFVALYQKCVHLGCRVPQCETSQWFECPCHGSQYNQVGEKKGGPAPRGLDRFPLTVSGGSITVDTGIIIQGPPIGVNTTGQESEGPHCIGAAAGGH